MISILKEKISETFESKPVKFNTLFGELNDKTKSFMVQTPDEYITVRINEHEDFVEVIKIDINESNDSNDRWVK